MPLSAVGFLLAMQVAQGTHATVIGTVRDGETGAPLAGAVIVLTDLNRATTTDAEGRYALREVPAGPQHILVRFIGHTQRALHALVPSDGQLEINVALQPEPYLLPTVEVRPPVAVRGLEGSDPAGYPDRSLSIAAVRNHPLLAEPDVFQALEGGEVVISPESPNGVHVRGGASDQTGYLLDGIPVFNPFHAAGVFSAWNPDALATVSLFSSALPAPPSTLSGSISAETRSPGVRSGAQGAISSTQARLAIDGSIGSTGAGYLVSFRSDFPGTLTSKEEASYLRNKSGDFLAKVEAPVLGGRVRLLGYDNENEIGAAAAIQSEAGPGEMPNRNLFEWHSRSLGAEWRRPLTAGSLRVLGWSATTDAGSRWAADAAPLRMSSDRRDQGLVIVLERGSAGANMLVGLRVEGSNTSYRLVSDSAPLSWRVDASTPVGTVFADLARPVGGRTTISVGTSLAATGGALYPAPRASLRYAASDRVTLTGSLTRNYQFVQSFRNAESVVGNVFPAELYVGAGAPGVPAARSDQALLAADYRPAAGVRLGAQAYIRDFDDLLLVAPKEGEPFTTGAFSLGTGTSRGLSLDAAVSSARVGLVASYGLQEVRFAYGESNYAPGYGATHLIEGGVIVFPAATASIRLGVSGATGRRSTAVSGGFEWEACNLLDQGCEFGGSPHQDGQRLGATALPSYLRFDLGVRKHWHVAIGGRDAMVAIFGTVTNLFGRQNVLTYARNPTTGEVTPIEMRPLAPLVVGLDWRF